MLLEFQCSINQPVSSIHSAPPLRVDVCSAPLEICFPLEAIGSLQGLIPSFYRDSVPRFVVEPSRHLQAFDLLIILLQLVRIVSPLLINRILLSLLQFKVTAKPFVKFRPTHVIQNC